MVGAERHARAGLASALLGLPRSDRAERRLRDAARWPRSTTSASPTPPTGCPGSLPYGVQKRVALARALVARPAAAAARRAGGRARRGRHGRARRADPRAHGDATSVLLVEHHMDLVMAVCDRVVVLDFGRRLAEGEPAEVQADPRVLDAYLGVEVDAAQVEVLRDGLRRGASRSTTSRSRSRPASITAVLGANGAGKTTLLRTISGLVRPRAGRVAARRRATSTRAAPEEIARLGVAHVPEGRGVIAELTRRGEPAPRRAVAARPADARRRSPRSTSCSRALARAPRRSRPARCRAASGRCSSLGRALMARPAAAAARRAVARARAAGRRADHGRCCATCASAPG